MLMTDFTAVSRVPTDLFAKIWEHNAIPREWSKGLTCKQALYFCLSLSKAFCRIFLKKI